MKDIGNILVGVAVLINAILAVVTYFKTIRTADLVEKLEINTNSIKDALIKVTGESEFAKGVVEGRKEQNIGD